MDLLEHFTLTVCKNGSVCVTYRHNLAQFVGLVRSGGLAQFVGLSQFVSLICIIVGDETSIDSWVTL